MIIDIEKLNNDQEKIISTLKELTIEKYPARELKIESYTDRGIRITEGTIYNEDLLGLLILSDITVFFDNGLVITKK